MRPNILLVILDSVRADFLSINSAQHDTTPYLETFSRSATNYTHAYAPSIWSLASHTSIFTGKESLVHGVNTHGDKITTGTTIWSDLQDIGYATGIFTTNPYLTIIDSGLNSDFEHTVDIEKFPFPKAQDPMNFTFNNGNRFIEYFKSVVKNPHSIKSLINGLTYVIDGEIHPIFSQEPTEDEIEDKFLNWISSNEKPWAACINFMDAHAPYVPREEFNKWGDNKLLSLQNSLNHQIWEFTSGNRKWWQCKALAALYQGTILQLDNRLRRIMNHLENNGTLEETLIVITSDHGDGFGERSKLRQRLRIAQHGYGIHDALLWVPLLVRAPRQKEARVNSRLATPQRFSEVVTNFVKEGTEMLSFESPNGTVLASSIERPLQFQVAERFHRDPRPFRGDAHALYEQTDSGITKYAVWGDDAAVTNVSFSTESKTGQCSDVAKRKVTKAIEELDRDRLRESEAPEKEIDVNVEERLRELGYL